MAKESTIARESSVNPINAVSGRSRYKSINDLADQMGRINSYGNTQRASAATRIYARYLENIGSTEENARDRYNSDMAFYQGNSREYRRLENVMENRRYPRSQYARR